MQTLKSEARLPSVDQYARNAEVSRSGVVRPTSLYRSWETLSIVSISAYEGAGDA